MATIQQTDDFDVMLLALYTKVKRLEKEIEILRMARRVTGGGLTKARAIEAVESEATLDLTGLLSVTTTCFRAYQTSVQSINPTTWTKMRLDSEGFDRDSSFDLVNNEFVVPSDGYYMICGTGTINGLGDGKKYIVSIYINNVRSTDARGTSAALDFVGACVIGLFDLNASDVVDIRYYHNHASARNTGGLTNSDWIGGYRLF